MIKSTLSNLGTYYLFIFKALSKVIKAIEKNAKNLPSGTWGEQKGSFTELEYGLQVGGKGVLGLGNLLVKNDALLAKWLWRFPCEDDNMWHSIIGAQYGLDVNGWNAKIGGRVLTTCPWKNISRIYPLFISFTRCDVGRVDKIKFWEEKWWGEEVLASKF